MQTPTSILRRSLNGLGLVGLVGSLAVSAQTAPDPSAAASGGVVELTPFVVSTDQDNGYAATETLAGTRLRTNLKDVASSMSVLTPDFLRDISATSLEDAVNFLPSTDVLQASAGNVSGNGSNFDGFTFRFGNGQNFSIRGVKVGTVYSNFFDTQAPNDFYNSDSLTLSRGPNSILFGVGGAAGSAISSLKRAVLTKTKTKVSFATDRWGTDRETLDHNQVLVRGRLALRINALHEDRNEFRPREGQWQRRLTLGLTAKPFKDTTVTVLHENWRFSRNQAALTPWFSNGLLNWVAAGRPTVDFVPGDKAWSAAGRTFVDASGKPVAAAPGVVTSDGFIHAQKDFDPRGVLTQNTNPNNVFIAGLGLPNPIWNLKYQPDIKSDTFDGVSSGPAGGGAANPLGISSYFPIAQDANMMVGSKDLPEFEGWGRWTQAFIEQKLATGLYLELAANQAESHTYIEPAQENYLQVDVAKYLPDNSLNPGYLQPFSQIAAQVNLAKNTTRDLRATLSYELDATRWNRWLGRHNFSVLAQNDITTGSGDRLRVVNKGSPGQPGWPADPEAAQNLLLIRRYYVNGQVDNYMDPKTLIQYLQNAAQQGTVAGSKAVTQPATNLDLKLFAIAQGSHINTQSESFAWQGYWLKDRLITTFGVRKDDISTYAGVGARDDYDPAIPVPKPLPATQTLSNYSYYSPSTELVYPTTALERNGMTRTYAGVLHATNWLSLTYNTSANFTPSGARTDMLGNPQKNSEGTTQDMGLRFFLLNDRLIVSTNYFKNAARNNSAGKPGFNSLTPAILNLLRTNYKAKGDSHFAAMPDEYPNETPNAGSYTDVTTNGYELSITFNPTPNWRMFLTGSSNTIKSTNLYPDAFQWIYGPNQYSAFATIPTWNNFVSELRKVAAGQPSGQFDLNPNDPVARAQANTDANLMSGWISSIQQRASDAKAVDGATLAPNGRYALNSVITYSFSQGRLKGLTLGLNGRWRSGGVAGYYHLPDPTDGTPEGVININRPIYGDDTLDIGSLTSYQWKLSKNVLARIQFNIENLFNFRKPLLRAVGTDSNGVYGTQYAEVPLRWELRRPRNFRLTATFEM